MNQFWLFIKKETKCLKSSNKLRSLPFPNEIGGGADVSVAANTSGAGFGSNKPNFEPNAGTAGVASTSIA